MYGMTGVTDTRYRNARRLADQVGGVVAFADKLGMSKAQASHIVGARPVKGIGHSIARRIEQAFGLATGSLDEPAEEKLRGGIRLVVSQEVRKVVGISGDLSYAAALGDDMAPTIEAGSIMVIDRGAALRGDGVYALSRERETFVRRVQRRLDGRLTLASDNARYDNVVVQSLQEAKLRVEGRVILVWSPRRL